MVAKLTHRILALASIMAVTSATAIACPPNRDRAAVLAYLAEPPAATELVPIEGAAAHDLMARIIEASGPPPFNPARAVHLVAYVFAGSHRVVFFDADQCYIAGTTAAMSPVVVRALGQGA